MFHRSFSEQNFRHYPESHIVIPQHRADLSAQVEALCVGIRLGHSLHASPSGIALIPADVPTGPQSGGQWLFCQSSGSTGRAKTIRRRPESWIASFEVTASRFGVGPEDCYAVLGALSHSLTLYGLLEALHLGADCHCLCGLQPRRQWEMLSAGAISVLYATPSQLRLILEAKDADRAKAPSVRLIFCGGGKLDSATRKGLAERFPKAGVFEFYGASETSFITIWDETTPEGSVGRAYPGVEIVVGHPSHPTSGDVADIWVKSPYLFDGYDGSDSGDTRWHEGYVSVGEMGELDESGNLFLKGRRSRMVTVADQNVFLEDAETVLLADPSVRLCAVMARPDRTRGHVLVAIVEASEKTEAKGPLADGLLALGRKALGPLAAPRQILFIDAMPMLASGKPDLKALEGWLQQRQEAQG
ncbi:AMP-binding protein [uncultured Cohaesibacter sp.]|uniref:AMP-binding protein n=1 Tax=uncultured Cohaesibacter sp. TaxID=1002546 RepID=UPI0029C773DC|nr:AMP-binding protein [uncultured Cohaesibacter sp.]